MIIGVGPAVPGQDTIICHLIYFNMSLPSYTCHKTVNAAKIIGMGPHDRGVKLHLDAPGRPAYIATSEWITKHNPTAGGYLVIYADGYVSFSPAKAFEDGYSLTADLSSEAVMAVAKEHLSSPDAIEPQIRGVDNLVAFARDVKSRL